MAFANSLNPAAYGIADRLSFQGDIAVTPSFTNQSLQMPGVDATSVYMSPAPSEETGLTMTTFDSSGSPAAHMVKVNNQHLVGTSTSGQDPQPFYDNHDGNIHSTNDLNTFSMPVVSTSTPFTAHKLSCPPPAPKPNKPKAKRLKVSTSTTTTKAMRKPCKLFFCEKCGKAFDKKWNLKAHNRVHTDEVPYPCRLGCGGNFKWGSTRTCHELKKCYLSKILPADQNPSRNPSRRRKKGSGKPGPSSPCVEPLASNKDPGMIETGSNPGASEVLRDNTIESPQLALEDDAWKLSCDFLKFENVNDAMRLRGNGSTEDEKYAYPEDLEGASTAVDTMPDDRHTDVMGQNWTALSEALDDVGVSNDSHFSEDFVQRVVFGNE